MANPAITRAMNPEQLRAIEAVTGPVCILAGAGSGKTTTITRRIANQVHTGTFEPAAIQAVTFTDRAAGEMRRRLAALGVEGVKARTFHSAALAQLRYFSPEPPGQILPGKGLALRQIANTLPKPYRFRPAGDLATEIEWAKNRRIGPDRYASSLGDHQPPIPADLMASVYHRYERGKRERGLIDFEDLLELTILMFQSDEVAREEFAARYRAFTVDEYQDVNLLQETLLRLWVGARDDLCVVGDDYQSIYGFTGASSRYLLDMPSRFHNTTVIRLETNYRSSPQVLDLANRLVPKLGGAEKVLHSGLEEGPEPVIRRFSDPVGELRFIVAKIRELLADGLPAERIAILYRVNFRSEDYEEELSRAGIPYQVSDGAFLTRSTGRQMIATLKRSRSVTVAADVRKAADRAGYIEEPDDDLGTQELTRQNDLGRFVRMAEAFDDGVRTAADFAADIELRFSGAGEGRGINLLTYHRAKGLEFGAVFLPRVEDGELPFKRARSETAIAEERRLFYVGITRAERHLIVSYVNSGRRKPSPFIFELAGASEDRRLKRERTPRSEIAARVGLELELSGGYSGRIVEIDGERALVELAGGAVMTVPFGEIVTCEGKRLPLGEPPPAEDELFVALKRWRLQRAKNDGLPAYVIFHDSTLAEIAERRPRSMDDLEAVSGVGPTKLERYGDDVIGVVSSTTSS